MEAPTEIIWQARDLFSGFPGTEGSLHGVTCVINKGERVAVLSLNSMERSAFLRTLCGLRPIKGGSLNVLGADIKAQPFFTDWDQLMPQNIRRRIGVCLENEGLLANVSIREGMELLFRFKYGDHTEKLRSASQKVVQSTCEHFALGAVLDRRPVNLNVAERRLAGLARAFLSKPWVLALENPSLSIGDSHQTHLWNALEYMFLQAERSALIATDDWHLAAKFCPNRWIVIDAGKIDFDGSPREFLRSKHRLAENLRVAKLMRKQTESILEEAS